MRRLELKTAAVPRVQQKIQSALREALYRRCTGCDIPIERINACCHMTCGRCRAEFSWICGKPYRTCRNSHTCMDTSVYLYKMPQIVQILKERGIAVTDE